MAVDSLRADLTMTSGVDVSSVNGEPFDFNKDSVGWAVGFQLDLPLDRLSERNDLRREQIDLEAAKRNLDDVADQIRADLRDALRSLASLQEDYVIQEQSVVLAERRIESTRLNFEAGRAETRDLLEAQEDLLAAQNSRTGALIDYTLARLALYRDAGLLRVDESGIGVDDRIVELLGGGD